MQSRPYLSSFGRNRGRSLSPRQQGLVDVLLPNVAITLADASALKLRDCNCTKTMLEIGFGAGEHIAAYAKAHPDRLALGCEPYINGVAKLLVEMEEQALSNIRIYTADARQLIDALPEGSIDEAYILFPDPWPKAKHMKRRLVNQDTFAKLARIHKAGGTLLLATDHYDYAIGMLEQLHETPYYRWTAKTSADWLDLPKEWVETKYQRKTMAEGRPPHFFHCIRV